MPRARLIGEGWQVPLWYLTVGDDDGDARDL
jgi:hypothetical protein